MNPLQMEITPGAGVLFHNHPRRKDKALLLDITIVNPCASSNLENAARHAGKPPTDAVERKKNKYRGSFPATYSLLLFDMSACGEVGSDVHALIKKFAIRRVAHRSEIHLNESLHLEKETEVASLRRRFFFYSRHFHSACVIIYADREWCLRAPDSSVRKARCLYTRLVPRGQSGARDEKERTASGAGTDTETGSGAGTAT